MSHTALRIARRVARAPGDRPTSAPRAAEAGTLQHRSGHRRRAFAHLTYILRGRAADLLGAASRPPAVRRLLMAPGLAPAPLPSDPCANVRPAARLAPSVRWRGGDGSGPRPRRPPGCLCRLRGHRAGTCRPHWHGSRRAQTAMAESRLNHPRAGARRGRPPPITSSARWGRTGWCRTRRRSWSSPAPCTASSATGSGSSPRARGSRSACRRWPSTASARSRP